jgi:hypothetical protein
VLDGECWPLSYNLSCERIDGVAVVAESSSIAVDDEFSLRNIAVLAANI